LGGGEAVVAEGEEFCEAFFDETIGVAIAIGVVGDFVEENVVEVEAIHCVQAHATDPWVGVEEYAFAPV